MTVKVTISNDDTARVVKVTQIEESYEPGEGLTHKYSTTTDLAGGQKQSFYIHASKRLIVTEDPNAAVLKS